MKLACYTLHVLSAVIIMLTSPLSQASLLSKVYLPQAQQEAYFDYRIDASLQAYDCIDTHLDKKHPILFAKYRALIEKLRGIEASQQWTDITFRLTNQHSAHATKDDDCDGQAFAWYMPVLHHQGDLHIDQTVTIDYPLLVEGNLIVNGNIIMKHSDTMVVVLGNIGANNLLYDYPGDDSHESLLYLTGKVTLTQNAYLNGWPKHFDKNLVAKHIFQLQRYFPDNSLFRAIYKDKIQEMSDRQNKAIELPSSPHLLRPGIFGYKDDPDAGILGEYLTRDSSPFVKPYDDTVTASKAPLSWQYFLEQWQTISDNITKADIAGGEEAIMAANDFTEDQKNAFNNEAAFVADKRTGQGFCVFSPYDLAPYINDAKAYTAKFSKPALTIYNEQNSPSSSTCELIQRYDNLSYLMRENSDLDYYHTAHLSLYSYRFIEADVINIYRADKPFLHQDPFLATYWLTHFGIVFDERYPEVAALAKQQNHPLVNSALSFFEERAFTKVAVYSGRVMNEEIEELFTGRYSEITSGYDIFRKNHSDFIYSYYQSNGISNVSAARALAYAIEHDYSHLVLEKALLLAEILEKTKSWSLLEQLAQNSQRNQFAWDYLTLRRSATANNKNLTTTLWAQTISQHHNIAKKTRIKALELLNSNDNNKTIEAAIATVQAHNDEEDIWQQFGVTDHEDAEQNLLLAKQLIQGEHSDHVKSLRQQDNTQQLLKLTDIVLDYIGEDDITELVMDVDTVLKYLHFAVEHQLYDYQITSALNHINKTHPEKIKPWADKLLSKPRLYWANNTYDYKGSRGITRYVQLLRQWAE